MIEAFYDFLTYPFLTRALVVGVLVSLCAALLGASLVLKRFSMIGDGLSHVGFGALSVASVLGIAPLTFAVPVVVLAAILLLTLSESGKMKGDAAIAFISTGSLAAGVLVVTLSKGANTDLLSYLFGSILAMSKDDVTLSIVLSCAVLLLFILFYHNIFSVTFDENFSKATGQKTKLYNIILAVLTAVTVVLGMRMMGAMLISALILFPALSAMRLCHSFFGVTVVSVVLSVLCFVIGLLLSYLLSAPTGATVVMVHIGAFLVCSMIGYVKKKFER